MDSDTAMRLAGSQPDYHVKDLFDAIEKGDYPKWLVYVQVMTPEKAKSAPIEIFDDTYTWPHDKYPLRRIGRLTLDKNVSIDDTGHDPIKTLFDYFIARQLLPRY